MRIGLLTIWKSLNYGAVLQALATYRYFQSAGFDVRMIDYGQPMRPGDVMDGPWTYFCNLYSPSRLKRMVSRAVRCLLEIDFIGVVRRFAKTHRMLSEFFGDSVVVCKTDRDLACCSELDAWVVGADQVWSPVTMYWLGEGYLLNMLPADAVRISYAAAISCEDFVCDVTGEDWTERYVKALPKFRALSMREVRLIPKVEQLIGRKIFWAVDPTLLYDAEQWDRMLGIDKTRPKKRHITIYWISDIRPYLEQILAFAERQNCEVHLFNEFDTLRAPMQFSERDRMIAYAKMRFRMARCKRLRVYRAADPRDFVRDLSTADGVIADSYHGLMFSTIYRRKAKIVIPPARERMGSRMRDFCERCHWKNVLVDDIPEELSSDTETGSRERLNSWIEDSRRWLDGELSQLRRVARSKC